MKLDGEVVRGIFETIDERASFVMRTDDGRGSRIAAGDVHFGAVASASQRNRMRILTQCARPTNWYSCRWAASARSA